MERALKSVLDWYDRVGIDVADLIAKQPAHSKPQRSRVETPKIRPTTPKTVTEQPSRQNQVVASSSATEIMADRAKEAAKIATKAQTLDALQSAMSTFHAGPISDHARQMVFARGNPEADIMVIGEAPGRDEDMQGKPFVGRSGQLLDRIFAAIGLSEQSLYITNVVNWRPPGNRNPNPDEILICKPFIQRHMELFAPKLIILVGGVSLTAMTGKTGIMKHRGQWAELIITGKAVPTLPIYHPAFLLRQPLMKKDCWHDMLALKSRLQAMTIKP